MLVLAQVLEPESFSCFLSNYNNDKCAAECYCISKNSEKLKVLDNYCKRLREKGILRSHPSPPTPVSSILRVRLQLAPAHYKSCFADPNQQQPHHPRHLMNAISKLSKRYNLNLIDNITRPMVTPRGWGHSGFQETGMIKGYSVGLEIFEFGIFLRLF